MNTSSLITVFNAIINYFSGFLEVLLGVILAGAGLRWFIKVIMK